MLKEDAQFDVKKFFSTRPFGVILLPDGEDAELIPQGPASERPLYYRVTESGVWTYPVAKGCVPWVEGDPLQRDLKEDEIQVAIKKINTNTDVTQCLPTDHRFQLAAGVPEYSQTMKFANFFYSWYLHTLFEAILPGYKANRLFMLGALLLATCSGTGDQKIHRDSHVGLCLKILRDGEAALTRQRLGFFCMTAVRNHFIRSLPPGRARSLFGLNLVRLDLDDELFLSRDEKCGGFGVF